MHARVNLVAPGILQHCVAYVTRLVPVWVRKRVYTSADSTLKPARFQIRQTTNITLISKPFNKNLILDPRRKWPTFSVRQEKLDVTIILARNFILSKYFKICFICWFFFRYIVNKIINKREERVEDNYANVGHECIFKSRLNKIKEIPTSMYVAKGATSREI